MAFIKFCNKNGCNRFVLQGVDYCDIHKMDKDKERHKEYDLKCRDKEAKAFYNSKEWHTIRAAALARDNGIDVYLFVIKGIVAAADTVHHIIELSEDDSKRCDLDNLISLSHETHNKISQAYKDDTNRLQIQQMLRDCLREFQRRLGGGRGV